jgi:hypothetical protein
VVERRRAVEWRSPVLLDQAIRRCCPRSLGPPSRLVPGCPFGLLRAEPLDPGSTDGLMCGDSMQQR